MFAGRAFSCHRIPQVHELFLLVFVGSVFFESSADLRFPLRPAIEQRLVFFIGGQQVAAGSTLHRPSRPQALLIIPTGHIERPVQLAGEKK